MVKICCISLKLRCKLEKNLPENLGLMLRRNRVPAALFLGYLNLAIHTKVELHFLPVIHFYFLFLLKISLQFTVSRN
jgi:hypothetical protein